jgi:hypothetical protein
MEIGFPEGFVLCVNWLLLFYSLIFSTKSNLSDLTCVAEFEAIRRKREVDDREKKISLKIILHVFGEPQSTSITLPR